MIVSDRGITPITAGHDLRPTSGTPQAGLAERAAAEAETLLGNARRALRRANAGVRRDRGRAVGRG
jgi:hypothetical protein